MSTLNITNGDSAASVMQQARIPGDILCWRDTLHEGPVPLTPAPALLSPIRTEFISSRGWADGERVVNDFRRRDAHFLRFAEYDRVLLWFEHDLYDQLQLLQILHWLDHLGAKSHRIELICVDDYLGIMPSDRLTEISRCWAPVAAEQYQLARRAWRAFCSDSPLSWAGLIEADLTALPFLGAAVVRHLEQFPDKTTGLGRTETQILRALRDGCSRPLEIFESNQRADGVRFMGDAPFWDYLTNLSIGRFPLLRFVDSLDVVDGSEQFHHRQVALTDLGLEVLEGKKDWLRLKPPDRWYGGVRLSAHNLWRWNGNHRTVFRST